MHADKPNQPYRNKGILEKVTFLLNISKSKHYSNNELLLILEYTKEHTDNLIIGRVFGYSVSDYAISALKWIGSDETIEEYDRIMKKLPESRKNTVLELIYSELYKQI